MTEAQKLIFKAQRRKAFRNNFAAAFILWRYRRAADQVFCKIKRVASG
jgi:hypothetical protein